MAQMPAPIRKTPLEHPRETLFEKSYFAVVRADGTLLPIEERLGRRLLRTLSPDTHEALDLLRRDCVMLLTSDGRVLAGMSTGSVYDRLWQETSARLATGSGDAEWRRRCREALSNIDRWRRALARDH